MLYPMCNNAEEDQMHLFINCQVTKLVGNLYSVRPCNLASNNFSSVLIWLDSLDHSDREELSDLSKIILMCWQIWNDK